MVNKVLFDNQSAAPERTIGIMVLQLMNKVSFLLASDGIWLSDFNQ
jgi:hypothetical protein